MNNEIKWGKGIPNYTKEDIMTEDLIYLFTTNIVIEYLKKEGYTINYATKNRYSFPNIIASKEDVNIAIKVAGCAMQDMKDLSKQSKYMMKDYTNDTGNKVYYANVGLASVDKERYESKLILKDDGFLVNFEGLTEVNIDLPEVGTDEYKFYISQKFANGLYRMDNESLKNILSNTCNLESKIDESDIKGKNKVIEYLFENTKDNNPNGFAVVKTVGDHVDLTVKELEVDGKIHQNATMKIAQEENKIMLLVGYINPVFNNDIGDFIMDFAFDKEGKIKKINILDSRLVKFDVYTI